MSSLGETGSSSRSSREHSGRWWKRPAAIITGIGVLAAGAVTAGYLVLKPKGHPEFCDLPKGVISADVGRAFGSGPIAVSECTMIDNSLASGDGSFVGGSWVLSDRSGRTTELRIAIATGKLQDQSNPSPSKAPEYPTIGQQGAPNVITSSPPGSFEFTQALPGGDQLVVTLGTGGQVGSASQELNPASNSRAVAAAGLLGVSSLTYYNNQTFPPALLPANPSHSPSARPDSSPSATAFEAGAVPAFLAA